jgi:hypothetical protein
MIIRKKHSQPALGTFLSIPKPRSLSMLAPIPRRPALSFYGDKDRDGVMNGFDCAPNNRRRQGPAHEEAKTEMTVIRSTPSDKNWMKKNKISPTELFNEALEEVKSK